MDSIFDSQAKKSQLQINTSLIPTSKPTHQLNTPKTGKVDPKFGHSISNIALTYPNRPKPIQPRLNSKLNHKALQTKSKIQNKTPKTIHTVQRVLIPNQIRAKKSKNGLCNQCKMEIDSLDIQPLQRRNAINFTIQPTSNRTVQRFQRSNSRYSYQSTTSVHPKRQKHGTDIKVNHIAGENTKTVQRTCGDNNLAKHTSFGKPEYGVLNNDSGTCMDVYLSNKAPVSGSDTTIDPSWWPGGLSGKMVQGHLWNAKVGGPGNDRQNLTPLTSSANSNHNTKVESKLKTDYNNGDLIHYVVEAKYPHTKVPHTKVTELTTDTTAQGILTPHLNKIPTKIHAEYTKYDPTTKADKGHVSWDIGNEHKGIK